MAAEVLLLCGAIVNLIWFRVYIGPETFSGGLFTF